MLEVLRKYGTPGWITDSQHFAEFLDLAYGATFRGEVWLYNNDLAVVSNPDAFAALYLRGVFGKHWTKVSAVKILVGEHHQADVFSPDGAIPNGQLRERLKSLRQEDAGEEKVKCIFFGKQPPGQASGVPEVPPGYTVVFYLHGDTLQQKDPSGIVMIRPHIYPFAGKNGAQYAVAWQLVDQPETLSTRLSRFNDFFSPSTAVEFFHVAFDHGEPRLVPGFPASYQARGSADSRDGLLLGQQTDYLILASDAEELRALEEVFGSAITPTPVRGDAFRLAVVRQHNDVHRIVFGETGPGITRAAVRTWEAIQLWRPKQVIYVGMAGGDPADDDIRIGDLIVGEEIVRYEHATVHDHTGRSKTSQWRCEYKKLRWDAPDDLKNKALRLKAQGWRPTLSSGAAFVLGRTAAEIRVLVQPIGSGNKLVLSPAYFRMLQDNVVRKVKAVEMEGDGVGEACWDQKLKLLMIRGIMDKCNTKSRGNELARSEVRKAVSHIVAQFVRKLLLDTV